MAFPFSSRRLNNNFVVAFVVFTFTHWSRLKIRIATFHRDSVLVTVPLMIGCIVGDFRP